MTCGCNKSRKSKISGMARKKKITAKQFMPAVITTAGFIVSKSLNAINIGKDEETGDDKKLGDNRNAVGAAKIAVGIALSLQKNRSAQDFGNGFIIGGLSDIANENIPQLADIGMNGPAIKGPNYHQYALEHNIAGSQGVQIQ